MATGRSLRLQLLAWILIPLTALLLFSVWSSYRNGRRTAELVQDSALLASARGIAEQIRQADGITEVLIPPSAIERFSSQDHDRVVYRVVGPAGELIAGYADVPNVPSGVFQLDPQWFDGVFRGEPIRAVALGQLLAGEVSRTAGVIVGQTLRAHNRMVDDLWLTTMWQEAAMVVLAALLALVGLRRGLAPMMRLRQAVRDRDFRLLSHFDPSGVQIELRPLVTALNGAIDQIEIQIDQKRRFIADAAHQLRTPLGLLRTQAAVGRRSPDNDEKDEALSAISLTATAMSRLTNQLLTLARIEAQAVPLADELVDLTDLLRKVITIQAESPLAQDRNLAFEAPDAALMVTGSRTLLTELVANLLDNALRYTASGGNITARLSLGADRIRLSVVDDGPGIPAPERSRVFDRFYRVPGTDQEGSGLGLAIVRTITEAHQAEVALANAPSGPGLLVEVSFPRARAV